MAHVMMMMMLMMVVVVVVAAIVSFGHSDGSPHDRDSNDIQADNVNPPRSEISHATRALLVLLSPAQGQANGDQNETQHRGGWGRARWAA